MSGGFYNYLQYRINQIADSIENVIYANGTQVEDEYGGWAGYDFSPETIEQFKLAVKTLRRAEIMANRIDWLISADDGEETFHKRLKKELDDLEQSELTF